MTPCCLSCGCEMEAAGSKKTKKSYKAKKWLCPVCGYSEMEFGQNGIDSLLIRETTFHELETKEQSEEQPDIDLLS